VKLAHDDKPMMDIAKYVATAAWERRARLDRPNMMPKMRGECDCIYCTQASPFQTYAYKLKEQKRKLEGYESSESEDDDKDKAKVSVEATDVSFTASKRSASNETAERYTMDAPSPNRMASSKTRQCMEMDASVYSDDTTVCWMTNSAGRPQRGRKRKDVNVDENFDSADDLPAFAAVTLDSVVSESKSSYGEEAYTAPCAYITISASPLEVDDEPKGTSAAGKPSKKKWKIFRKLFKWRSRNKT
jgi:hypothetical protein